MPATWSPPRGDINGDGPADVLVSGRTADDALLPSAVFVVFGKRDTAPVDLASLGVLGASRSAATEVPSR